jgi:hypothetical protein
MRIRCVALVAVCALATPVAARADDARTWRDIETKYIFGFTEGSGIGLEGEKEFSVDTVTRMGKGGGRYWASETKLEFEFTPNQYIQLEFGPFISGHSIRNVAGLTDLSQVAFGGFFGEIRYLMLERTSNQPLSITLSAEPEYRHIDETDASKVTNYELELKINGDLELIANRLFAGFNFLYEPEMTKDPAVGGWEKEAKWGGSAALAYRVTPSVVLGGEAWYLRHYDSLGFKNYTGDAIFVGPTMFVQIAPKVFVAGSWNYQVRGSDVDDPGARVNLAEFSRQRAKLKAAVEF